MKNRPIGTAHELLRELQGEIHAIGLRSYAVRRLVNTEPRNATELQERMFGIEQVARDIEAAYMRSDEVADELRQRLDELVAPSEQVTQ